MGQDVIFVLKLAADPKNAATAKATEKIAIDTQDRIAKATTKTTAQVTAEEKKRAAFIDRIRLNSLKLQFKQFEEGKRAQEKAAADEVSLAKKTADEIRKQADKAAKEKERASARSLREYETSLAKQVAAHATAQAHIQSGQQRTLAGISQTIDGGTQLVRAFALLGLAGEKDLEKALRTFAKIEAAGQATKGIIQVVNGIAAAYQGYSTAVKGAAASQAALSAIEATSASRAATGAATRTAASAVGGTAAGAGGAVGGASLTIGAAIAAIASVGTVLLLLKESIDGTAKNLDSLTQKIAQAEVGWGEWIANTFGDKALGALNLGSTLLPGVTSAISGSAESGRTNDRFSKAKRQRDLTAIDAADANRAFEESGSFASDQRSALQASREARARSAAGRGLAGLDRSAAEQQATAAIRSQEFQRASQTSAAAALVPETGTGGALGQRAVALRDQVSAIDAMIESQKELARIEQERGRTSLEAAQKELSASRESLQLTEDRIRSLESERASALGALSGDAFKDPVAAQAAVDAARAARAGENISLEQARTLQRTGLSEFNPAIQATEEREAKARGLGELLAPNAEQLAAARQQKIELESKIVLDEKLIIQIEGSTENTVTAIIDALGPFLAERENAIKQQAKNDLARQDSDRRAREAQEAQSRAE